jgi:hypothetical protein
MQIQSTTELFDLGVMKLASYRKLLTIDASRNIWEFTLPFAEPK